MVEVPAAVLEALGRRRGVGAFALFWFTARRKSDGVQESLGLWTGDGPIVLPFGAAQRTYHGPAVVRAGRIRASLGLQVPEVTLELANLAVEVEVLLRNYEVRGAEVEIHTLLSDVATGQAIAAPFLRFRGRVDGLGFAQSPVNEQGVATVAASVVLLPGIERLRVPLQAFRSDADQQAVHPGDRFFRHAATAAIAEVVVGERKQRGSQTGQFFGDRLS